MEFCFWHDGHHGFRVQLREPLRRYEPTCRGMLLLMQLLVDTLALGVARSVFPKDNRF